MILFEIEEGYENIQMAKLYEQLTENDFFEDLRTEK